MDEVVKAGADASVAEGAKKSQGQTQKPIATPSSAPSRAATTVIRDWKRPAALGYALIIFTFVVLGGWSAIAKLDSAVTAPGFVAKANNRKTVQHLEGGIVREILVHEGEHVTAGQVLFRLNPTQAGANLDLQQNQLDGLLAQEARLLAERDRASHITWPDELEAKSNLPTVKQAIADQIKQFTDRQASLHGQIDVLKTKIAEFHTEIGGLQTEREATKQQLGYIVEELTDVNFLLSQNLVQKSRALALDRERSRLEGVIGRSVADEAKAENGIGEAKLQIQQVQNKFDEDVASAILDVRQKVSDAREKIRVARDVFHRIDVTSPVTGTVQNLKVFTIGGVIKPGETLLEVVPDQDALIVQAHISPRDIDRMSQGMRAEVRFTSFKASTLPIVLGRVESVSQDSMTDEANKQSYFLAQVVVDKIPEELRNRLVAGMPAELIFPTGERTVLNYLVRPLEDRMNSAFRER
jgi:HlyD family type I secretion membrane fusion protein